MTEPTPKALFALNREEGNLQPIHEAIWEDQELYDLVEDYLNKQGRSLAHIP